MTTNEILNPLFISMFHAHPQSGTQSLLNKKSMRYGIGRKMKIKKYTNNHLLFIENHRKTSTTSFMNRYSNIWTIIVHVLTSPCFLILIPSIPNQKVI